MVFQDSTPCDRATSARLSRIRAQCSFRELLTLRRRQRLAKVWIKYNIINSFEFGGGAHGKGWLLCFFSWSPSPGMSHLFFRMAMGRPGRSRRPARGAHELETRVGAIQEWYT